MDRSAFAQHFLNAAQIARDFARKFLEEDLPDEMSFRVHLNSSYDKHAGADVKLFPGDSSDERTLATKQLDADGVVGLLWRDGFVPEWVDLMVVGLTPTATILDVVSCGRFAADEKQLYYAQTGIAPFSPRGPVLPFNHVDDVRFSVYERSSCWSAEDLALTEQNASKVWSLELHGPEFDGVALTATFPRLEIFELDGVRLAGEALGALERLPKLRHLRATIGACPSLDLSGIPPMRDLQTLALRNLPSKLKGSARLATVAPQLKELTLAGYNVVEADSALRLPALDHLTIEFPAIPRWIQMPASLDWLSLRVPQAADTDLRSLLAACPENLSSLGLRGTPVSDAVLPDLERFSKLAYLDAVDTRITKDALRRFAVQRPGFKCSPNVKM